MLVGYVENLVQSLKWLKHIRELLFIFANPRWSVLLSLASLMAHPPNRTPPPSSTLPQQLPFHPGPDPFNPPVDSQVAAAAEDGDEPTLASGSTAMSPKEGDAVLAGHQIYQIWGSTKEASRPQQHL